MKSKLLIIQHYPSNYTEYCFNLIINTYSYSSELCKSGKRNDTVIVSDDKDVSDMNKRIHRCFFVFTAPVAESERYFVLLNINLH